MATIDRRGVSVDATDTAIAGSPNPGLGIKAPCLVATTGNIALSGLQTIDSVALAAGNRVLVRQQADPTTNGIYNASGGPWTRAIDANGNEDFASGLQVTVSAGATFARIPFQLISADPIVLGTSALNFTFNSLLSTRRINTTAPLVGGGDLSADRTHSIAANGISYPLFQQVAASSLVGNPSGGLATAQGITLGATLAFSGAVLQTAVMSGDISSAANSFLATIAAGAVSNPKMANMAAWTFKANATGGAAAPSDITIDGLTEKASPAATDEVVIWDVAGAALKKAKVSSVGSAGSVSSIAGNTGAFTLGRGIVNSANVILADPLFHRGYLSGLTISNDGVAPNTKIDVAAGLWCDDTQAILINAASGAVDCTTTGANGLDAGALAASAWYHVFAIAKTDGTNAFLASTSPSAPTFPAGYTLKRRIGSFRTDGASHILAFTQRGQEFFWATPVHDVGLSPIPNNTSNTVPLTVPTGVVVKALLSVGITGNATGANVYVRALTETDLAATYVNAAVTARDPTTTSSGGISAAAVWTNANAQVAYRSSSTGGSSEIDIFTLGWFDNLGK